MAIKHYCRFHKLSLSSIRKWHEFISWHELSLNEHIPWDFDLMKEFETKIKFSDEDSNFDFGMEENGNIIWSVEMFEYFEHRINKDTFFQCVYRCTPAFFDKYLQSLKEGKYNGYVTVIDEAITKVYQMGLATLGKDGMSYGDIKQVEPFQAPKEDKLKVVYKPNKFTLEEIIAQADTLDFEELSTEIYLPWSEELIDRFIDKWYWGGVKYEYVSKGKFNPFIAIDEIPIRIMFCGLANNEGIKWTNEMVLKYWFHLHAVGFYAWAEKLDFSIELLYQLEGLWDYEQLPYLEKMWQQVYADFTEEDWHSTMELIFQNEYNLHYDGRFSR
jgi:hypothetical protein